MNEEELKKDQLPQILHVKDLQVLLSISHNTAYELVRSGKIRSIRIGRTYKIPLPDGCSVVKVHCLRVFTLKK